MKDFEQIKKDIIKGFNQFKLGNSLFKIKKTFDKELNDDQVITKISNELAITIISKYKSAINIERNNDHILAQSELLVLKMEDYKSIIEGTIQTMTMEQIKKIRGEEI